MSNGSEARSHESHPIGRRCVVALLVSSALAVACRPTGADPTPKDAPKPGADGDAGKSSEALYAGLLAALHHWVPYPLEEARYAGFLAWRSNKIPGAKKSYEDAARKLDEAAKALGAASFSAAGKDRQTRVLERLDKDESTTVARGDLLRVFAATDAWRVLGYDAYPASPRGLDAYKTMWSGGGDDAPADGGKHG